MVLGANIIIMPAESNKIFIVEDDKLILRLLTETFLKEGYKVTCDSGSKGVVKRLEGSSPDLLLLDIKLPQERGLQIMEKLKQKNINYPVIIITGDEPASTAMTAIKLGAYDYIIRPVDMEKLKIVARNAIEVAELRKTVERFRMCTVNEVIIGNSALMTQLTEKIKKMASQRLPNILIEGESGTGKELVAQALHKASSGCLNRFLAINCSALPINLIESELFGHEKGAFTDAKEKKKGLFEEAHKGTLLLDEIGDMELSLQAKLLRVLESRTIRRIGGFKEIPFDVMVIATTNRPLRKLQKEGKFRQDLFYRLNMFSLRVPALRERKDDIPLLTDFFLSQFRNESSRSATKLSPSAIKVLMDYDWPGNVRELKNIIAQVCLFNDINLIEPEHIYQVLEVSAAGQSASLSLPEYDIGLYELEKKLIQETLLKVKGNMTKAAKMLNITYDTLRYRIKKFNLDV
jgi:two-component system response regulator AtoC